MPLGLDANTQLASSFYNVEGTVSDEIISELQGLPGIESVQLVKLS